MPTHKRQAFLAISVILFLVACNPQPLPVAPTPIPTLPPATLPSGGGEASTAAPSTGEQAQGASASVDRAEEGRRIVQETGCLGCHSVDGTKLVGPTFQGLFGSETTFEDGTTATADESYIKTSILRPGEQIVQGYTNVMPSTYEQQLSDDQIDAIVAFIESLE